MIQMYECYEFDSDYNNQNHPPITSLNFDQAGFAQFNTTNFVNLKIIQIINNTLADGRALLLHKLIGQVHSLSLCTSHSKKNELK